MNESEFQEFLFDSDVVLALMRGLSYEEAMEEAREIRRDEREWLARVEAAQHRVQWTACAKCGGENLHNEGCAYEGFVAQPAATNT